MKGKFRKFDGRKVWAGIGVSLLVLSVPVLMFLALFQMHRYTTLSAKVDELNVVQYRLVDENKRLVSDISALSGSDRIEELAVGRFGMHLASTDEIVRVEVNPM